MSEPLYTRPIRTFHLIEGAKQAEGLCVIIDVFRAFSLECYLYHRGAALVRPCGSVEETLRLHERIPGSLLQLFFDGFMDFPHFSVHKFQMNHTLFVLF